MSSVNWQKIKTASEAKAKIRHNDKSERMKNNHENRDINKLLTAKNLCLDGRTYAEKCDAYDKRVAYCKGNMKRVRSDAVTMIGLNIKLPPGLTHADYDTQAAWCQDCYRIIGDYVGYDNIVSATADFDEIHEFYNPDTDQMELSRPEVDVKFVPEVDGRLCAKQWQTKGNMRELNNQIEEMTQQQYGMAFMTGAGAKNVSTEQLKVVSAKAEAKKVKADMVAQLFNQSMYGVTTDMLLDDLEARKTQYEYMTARLAEQSEDYTTRIEELSAREQDIDTRTAALEAQERALNARQEALEDDEEKLLAEKLKLRKIENTLRERERMIQANETLIEYGRRYKRQQDIDDLSSRIDDNRLRNRPLPHIDYD